MPLRICLDRLPCCTLQPLLLDTCVSPITVETELRIRARWNFVRVGVEGHAGHAGTWPVRVKPVHRVICGAHDSDHSQTRDPTAALCLLNSSAE